MSRKIDYSKVTSTIIERGETLFPFVSFNEKRDADKILEESIKYLNYCKRHKFLPLQIEEKRKQKIEEIWANRKD
jgi:hypothetical protein